MIRNYLNIALRNLKRHRVYASINILGLAVGVAACLILFTVVKYELSYDTFQPNYSRIYHIGTQDKTETDMFYTPGIPFPALEAVRTDMPQLLTGALYASFGSQVTVLSDRGEITDKKFIEATGFFFADPQFCQVFNYTWIKGSPGVLQEPNTTVLTQATAEKYFGSWQDAVGKLLKLDNEVTVKVGGIIEDVPANTDFPLKIVTSLETMKKAGELYSNSTQWGRTTSNFQLFTLLPPNVTAASINKQLLTFGKKHYNYGHGVTRTNFLRPLSEIHFDNRFGTLGDHVTSKTTLWTLSLIGIFIIIMACINFINLSTAQAVGRSKEIGVRKVLGSNRIQLFWQIIGETAIIVLVSCLLAIGIALLCMPYISHVASIPEKLKLLNGSTCLFIAAVMVVVTLFAGLYPAFILSGFNAALALKNKITSATVGGISVRRGLVVTQFAISQVLIIGTIVAISQMNFVQNADLGFNKEAILTLSSNTDSTILSREEALKSKLLQVQGVQSVTFSTDVPSSDNNWGTNFAFDHRDDEEFTLYTKFADEDYLKTYGLQLVAGRSYEKSDTVREVVINETLVAKLGVKDAKDIIGKEIRMGRSPWKTIVGVVKDFKTNSLREQVKPLLIAGSKRFYRVTGIKLRTNNIAGIQTAIQNVWNEFNPEYAYTSTFLDDDINNFYRQEQQLSLLYKIFAGIAIFISCLGLYGLVSFMAAQRTKEVGIRKVLGASVGNIIYLFSKEFTVLIIVAFLIATPVAYYMMSNWLQNFAFRIDMNAQVFILAIVASVIVAWITVGYKSVKAALANPVRSLRSE